MNSGSFDLGSFQAQDPGPWGRPLRCLGECASTQDALEAWAQAEALAEGAGLVADHQWGGRGRRGRAWESEPGQGLLFTLLLRPQRPPEGLSLVLGLATAEALASLGVEAQLKWPNDIWVQGRKVAGLLLEQRGKMLLAGCGVNVSQSTWPEALQAKAVSLAQAGCQTSREALLAALCRSWEKRASAWQEQGLGPVLLAWRKLDALSGARLSLEGPQGPIVGDYKGLDDHGRLILGLDGGERKVFASGDVERLERG